jgi:hypothetical protein
MTSSSGSRPGIIPHPPQAAQVAPPNGRVSGLAASFSSIVFFMVLFLAEIENPTQILPVFSFS